MKNAPVLVIKRDSNGDYKHLTLPTDGEVCTKYYYSWRWWACVVGMCGGRVYYIHTHTHTQPELNIVASFDRRGERIVTGSSKGKVHVCTS